MPRARRAPDVVVDATAEPVLRHVLIAGGTAEGWARFGVDRWRERLRACSEVIASFTVPWLTIRPVEGVLDPASEAQLLQDLTDAVGGVAGPAGVECEPVRGVTVLVSPDGDGRRRIADAISALADAGVPAEAVDEQRMVGTLLAPSGAEPDLVVVLGPPDRLPPSLVWELAYAELVFLDVPWEELDPTHLQLAVDDFRRRDRRFGGIDA